MSFPDLRVFLDRLRHDRDLVEITVPVDRAQEAAEIHRRVVAAGGPALLFRNVTNADFPLVTNLFGTARRAELAFGERPQRLIRRLVDLLETALPPTPANLWGARDVIREMPSIGLRRGGRGPVTDVVTDDVDCRMSEQAHANSDNKVNTVNRTIRFSLRKVENKEKKFLKKKKPRGGPVAPEPPAATPMMQPTAAMEPVDTLEVDEEGEQQQLANKQVYVEDTWHTVHASRLHVNNFDIGDFGFLGPPLMVIELSKLWYYCITVLLTKYLSF